MVSASKFHQASADLRASFHHHESNAAARNQSMYRRCLRSVRSCKPSKIDLRDLNLRQLTRAKLGNKAVFAELGFREQVAMIRDGLRANPFLISPQSEYMKGWDGVTMTCLVLTAVITPYEVALLTVDGGFLYGLNRVIDVVFVKDMFMQFFMKVPLKSRQRTTYIRSPEKIVAHYLKTWFILDLLSVLPYDVIAGSLLSSSSPANNKARVARLLRILRLVKLARILKASRVIKRWQNRIALSSRTTYLIKFTILILCSCHWMACLWSFVGVLSGTNLQCRDVMAKSKESDVYLLLQEFPSRQYFLRSPEGGDDYDPSAWEGQSWVTNFASGRSAAAPLNPCMHMQLYVAALYWAVMTITSIGYGDILPVTIPEYLVCSLCMLISSIVWAYILGSACNILSNLNPEQNAFDQRLDAFNAMAEDQHLPAQIRHRGREYIREAQKHEHYMRNREISDGLGKELKGFVAQEMCQHYLGSIWIFHGTSDPFREDVANKMLPHFFEKQEIVELFSHLCVVERGAVGRCGRIFVPFNFWGTDLIIRLEELRRKEISVTLAFTEIVALSREELSSVVSVYPQIKFRLRRAAVLLAVQSVARAREEEKDLAEANRNPGLGFVHMMFDGLADVQERKPEVMNSDVLSDLVANHADLLSQENDFGSTEPTMQEQLAQILALLQRQAAPGEAPGDDPAMKAEQDKLEVKLAVSADARAPLPAEERPLLACEMSATSRQEFTL